MSDYMSACQHGMHRIVGRSSINLCSQIKGHEFIKTLHEGGDAAEYRVSNHHFC